MSVKWRSPYRARAEISQMFNDGLVHIYSTVKDGDNPSLHPTAAETLRVTLNFAERRMGLERYATTKSYFNNVERVIRVPQSPYDIRQYDVAIIQNVRYRIVMIQALPGVYPVCQDLTLAREEASSSTVTVYNIRENPRTFERDVCITVLPYVSLLTSDAVRAAAGMMRPLTSSSYPLSGISLRIPLSVAAVDGVTGAAREWVGAREYTNAADRSGLWTLDVNKDFIVRGRVVDEDATFESLTARYDGVYRVTKVSLNDAGAPDGWVLEVGGA